MIIVFDCIRWEYSVIWLGNYLTLRANYIYFYEAYVLTCFWLLNNLHCIFRVVAGRPGKAKSVLPPVGRWFLSCLYSRTKGKLGINFAIAAYDYALGNPAK